MSCHEYDTCNHEGDGLADVLGAFLLWIALAFGPWLVHLGAVGFGWLPPDLFWLAAPASVIAIYVWTRAGLSAMPGQIGGMSHIFLWLNALILVGQSLVACGLFLANGLGSSAHWGFALWSTLGAVAIASLLLAEARR